MDIPVRASLSFLAVQTPAADTVVMVAARDGLGTAAAWAMVVVGAFFLLLVPILLLLFLQLRKVNRTVRELGEKGLRQADPLLERGKSAMDNVEFVTMAVRTDVQRVNASVRSLTDRLQQASDRMEERIEEFNALMEVVQGEAEDILLGTAATVRGVRAGARALGQPGEAGPTGPAPEEEEELRQARPGGEEDAGEVYVSRPAGGGAPPGTGGPGER